MWHGFAKYKRICCKQTKRNEYVNHSPNVLFNEDCMPYGAAGFVNCAVNWLKNNR